MPSNARDIYEALRADVVCGAANARDVGAIVFHGLWRGLAVLSPASQPPPAQPRANPRVRTTSMTAHDRQLVRMLANMVLATETGGAHVY